MSGAAKVQGVVALFLLTVATLLSVTRWDLVPLAAFVVADTGLFWLAGHWVRGSGIHKLGSWVTALTATASMLGILAIVFSALTYVVGPWGTISHSLHAALGKVVAATFALALTFSIIFVSSIIDSVFVQPYLDGSKPDHAMPCLAPPVQDWESVTRTWLLHRLLAWVGMIVGGAAAFMFFVAVWLPGIEDSTLATVAAVATVLAGFYISRVAPAIAFVLNPPFYVGDVVTLADDASGTERSYYVMDVAMEGFKLALFPRPPGSAPDDGEAQAPDVELNVGARRRPHDRILDLADVSHLLRRRDVQKPCSTQICALVNPYCPKVAGRLVVANEAPPVIAAEDL